MKALTPEESLTAMKFAANVFYSLAIKTQCHPFIEFAGLLNEYIKICEENLARGIDFRDEHIHSSSRNMVIQDYEIDYMNEKLECIFQGKIMMQSQK